MLRFILTLALCLSFSTVVAAQQEHAHGDSKPAAAMDVVKLALYPERLPDAGETVRVIAQLTLDGKPLIEDALRTVHTQKIHLLVVDPTLTDYHHLHPVPTATPGSYRFDFTPKLAGKYRAWADVTTMTGGQTFAMADMGESDKEAAIDKKASTQAEAGGYVFTMSCDTPLTQGKESMCKVSIADSTKDPVLSLEPVMGAFGHLVGFFDDTTTLLHAHPMGDKPTTDAQRGGPDLMFHLAPTQAGFVKLFLQVNIKGQEIFAPFGVMVAAPAPAAPASNPQTPL